MASIAAGIALLFLLLTGASTLLHRDPARLGRAVVMVAGAGLGTGAAVAVTGLLVAISDQLSAAVTTGSGQDLRTALRGMGAALAATGVVTGNGAAPLFAVGLGGVVTALAAAVIWLELLLREVAIYAALLFFPIGLAGLAWAPSAAWARRLAELLAALIFAKFVIVAILTLAAAGLASGSQGFAGVLAGIALLVVSAFAPFLLLRLIGVAEVAAAAGVLEGARQRGTRPACSPAGRWPCTRCSGTPGRPGWPRPGPPGRSVRGCSPRGPAPVRPPTPEASRSPSCGSRPRPRRHRFRRSSDGGPDRGHLDEPGRGRPGRRGRAPRRRAAGVRVRAAGHRGPAARAARRPARRGRRRAGRPGGRAVRRPRRGAGRAGRGGCRRGGGVRPPRRAHR